MKTAALILAAGAGTRFGGGKQWADVAGLPMLGRVIENCLEAGCSPVQVATGYAHDKVGEICRIFGAQASYHEHWKDGMSSSVNFGLQSILCLPDWEQLVVMAGDMPWFDPAIFWARHLNSNLTGKKQNSWTNEVARPNSSGEAAHGILYPQGIGMPLLLPRNFIGKHCYFVSQNSIPDYPLRKSLAGIDHIITYLPGPHTKDVDHPSDLLIP